MPQYFPEHCTSCCSYTAPRHRMLQHPAIPARLHPHVRQECPINLSAGAARTALTFSVTPTFSLSSLNAAHPNPGQLGWQVCWGRTRAQLLPTFTPVLHLQLLLRHHDQLRDPSKYPQDPKHHQKTRTCTTAPSVLCAGPSS